jgi:hypothetical protein
LGELLYQYFLCDYFGDAGDNLQKAGRHHALAGWEVPWHNTKSAKVKKAPPMPEFYTVIIYRTSKIR